MESSTELRDKMWYSVFIPYKLRTGETFGKAGP